MQAVIETAIFVASAKRAGMTRGEVEDVVDYVARNPRAGDLIPGSGGARKLRWKGQGRGKSGGYRVVTYFADKSTPVYLISAYAKNQKANLSAAERHAIRGLIAAINAARKGNT